MKATRWVLLILGGAILWLAARGRLADVVHAMETDPPGGGGTGDGGAGASSSPATGSSGGLTAPRFSLFLNDAPATVLDGFSLTGVQMLDSSGLASVKPGDKAVADWDYGVPDGSIVHLPPGGPYKVERSWEPGRTAMFSTPNGGVFEFLHLSSSDSLPVGAYIAGGTSVGRSGHPQGPLEAGSGPHLAVVADSAAATYLGGL